MGINIVDYFSKKTVKLSDSYKVEVKKNALQGAEELVNCAGFTIPTLKNKTEVYHYGNLSQKFLIPDYSFKPVLTIELIESDEASVKRSLYIDEVDGVNVGSMFSVKQSFDKTGYLYQRVDYSDSSKRDFDELKITILSNNLDRGVYYHKFNGLRVEKIKTYQLSYTNESLLKWVIELVFDEYERGRM